MRINHINTNNNHNNTDKNKINSENEYFLNIGNKCNNSCWFCQYEYTNKKLKDISEIKNELSILNVNNIKTKDEKSIILCGEPTLHPKLLQIINIINETHKIVFLTNGRAFCHVPFAKKIIQQGISEFIIKINGHTKNIHDPLSRAENSFLQTEKGIKTLLSLGANVTLLVYITEQNFIFIPKIIEKARSLEIKSIIFSTVKSEGFAKTNYEKIMPRFSDFISALDSADKREINVFVSGLPHCISEKYLKYDIQSNEIATKPKKCNDCRNSILCNGVAKEYLDIYGDYELIPKNNPEEIAIEVGYECNLNCPLCFNQEYEKESKQYNMNTEDIMKCIDKIPQNFVSHIRFTGGEPLLRKDLPKLLEYSKNRGFKIWLNTNCTLINEENAKMLSLYVENVLIPLNGYDEESEYNMTGKREFENKIKGINLLKKTGIKTVRCGTVLTKENIENLEKIYSLVLTLELDDWESYRPIGNEQNKEPITKQEMLKAIQKLNALNNSFDKQYKIVNAVPFCIGEEDEVSMCCLGAESDDGHIRFVIGPDKNARPSYYLNEKIGNIDENSIEEIWNCDFLKKMRMLKLLPNECKLCKLKGACRGGSRFASWLVNKNYSSTDPFSKYASQK